MDSCVIATQMYHSETHSAHGQPLNLLGITYLVGKIKLRHFYLMVLWLSKERFQYCLQFRFEFDQLGSLMSRVSLALQIPAGQRRSKNRSWPDFHWHPYLSGCLGDHCAGSSESFGQSKILCYLQNLYCHAGNGLYACCFNSRHRFLQCFFLCPRNEG